eukprot:gb/GECH01001024.1/.p1 GENE.gb/GECH01001024.1/~~gb/GECH01001024.1/.p1  ORF type:complete len:390 (+),score=98.94 gb/GECH01001024.1/:1-1170(+)
MTPSPPTNTAEHQDNHHSSNYYSNIPAPSSTSTARDKDVPWYWKEESPLFMNNLDEDNSKVQALQSLVFDESTGREIAHNFKEQGNLHMQHARDSSAGAQQAVECYSRALDTEMDDHTPLYDPDTAVSIPSVAVLRTTLYANRAQAHLTLHNYRSALHDAQHALAITPSHNKALFRGAKAALHAGHYTTAADLLDRLHTVQPDSKAAGKLRRQLQEKKAAEERSRVQQQEREKKREASHTGLIRMLTRRGIQVGREEVDAGMTGSGVRLDQETRELKFEVLLLYDDAGQSDVLQNVGETDTLAAHLTQVMPPEAPPVPWDDPDRPSFRRDHIRLFYGQQSAGSSHPVYREISATKEVGEWLREPGYVLPGTRPVVHVVLANSPLLEDML